MIPGKLNNHEPIPIIITSFIVNFIMAHNLNVLGSGYTTKRPNSHKIFAHNIEIKRYCNKKIKDIFLRVLADFWFKVHSGNNGTTTIIPFQRSLHNVWSTLLKLMTLKCYEGRVMPLIGSFSYNSTWFLCICSWHLVVLTLKAQSWPRKTLSLVWWPSVKPSTKSQPTR